MNVHVCLQLSACGRLTNMFSHFATHPLLAQHQLFSSREAECEALLEGLFSKSSKDKMILKIFTASTVSKKVISSHPSTPGGSRVL